MEAGYRRSGRVEARRGQAPGAATRYEKPAVLLCGSPAWASRTRSARSPLLVGLDGKPGTVAILTTPDARASGRALNPGNRYPDWQPVVAARSALLLGFYRPGRVASNVRPPLLVVVADQHRSALAGPGVRVAQRAPRGEPVRLPGGYYAPFLEQHERAAVAEPDFLRRHLVRAHRAEGVRA